MVHNTHIVSTKYVANSVLFCVVSDGLYTSCIQGIDRAYSLQLGVERLTSRGVKQMK